MGHNQNLSLVITWLSSHVFSWLHRIVAESKDNMVILSQANWAKWECTLFEIEAFLVTLSFLLPGSLLTWCLQTVFPRLQIPDWHVLVYLPKCDGCIGLTWWQKVHISILEVVLLVPEVVQGFISYYKSTGLCTFTNCKWFYNLLTGVFNFLFTW